MERVGEKGKNTPAQVIAPTWKFLRRRPVTLPAALVVVGAPLVANERVYNE